MGAGWPPRSASGLGVGLASRSCWGFVARTINDLYVTLAITRSGDPAAEAGLARPPWGSAVHPRGRAGSWAVGGHR